jgi:hypothetical protein
MKPLTAIVLVLAFGAQVRPAQSTAGHRTPVEVHLVSVGGRCDTADPDFIAGLDGAFSAESLTISKSEVRTTIPNRFRRARSGKKATVVLFLSLQYEGSEAW